MFENTETKEKVTVLGKTFNSEEEKLKYLSRKIEYKVEQGKVVGKHRGAHYFTKGQRKGLAVGGTLEPLFVIDTNVDDNIIYTGQGKEHPGLLKKALFVTNEELHWIREDLALKKDETMQVMARIRYRQPLQKAILHKNTAMQPSSADCAKASSSTQS